jgi:large subunit ribosomal protein L21
MTAVVEIAGVQFTVHPNDTLNVPLLQGEPGETVNFDNILFAETEGESKIGTPYIQGSVEAKIIEHGKGDKVLVFHKNRRKGYRKLNGHRAKYTQIEITNIKI